MCKYSNLFQAPKRKQNIFTTNKMLGRISRESLFFIHNKRQFKVGSQKKFLTQLRNRKLKSPYNVKIQVPVTYMYKENLKIGYCLFGSWKRVLFDQIVNYGVKAAQLKKSELCRQPCNIVENTITFKVNSRCSDGTSLNHVER